MNLDVSDELCVLSISLRCEGGLYYLTAIWYPKVVPGSVVHNVLDRAERFIGGYERWSYRHASMGKYSAIKASIPVEKVCEGKGLYPGHRIELNYTDKPDN